MPTLPDQLRRAKRYVARRVDDRRRAAARRASGPLARLSPEEQVDAVYRLLLHRPVDPSGAATYLPSIEAGTMSVAQLAEWVISSGEWWTAVTLTEINASLHFSRELFVRSLPPARRILDLGGTALGSPQGAMVLMGYPYAFEEIVVVDLPPEDRDSLYHESVEREVTQTALGPVRFRYHSMADLSDYPDGSFDLVYSGQSIEHVPVDVADHVLGEVRRVLRPDGHLALDTPNGPVCRLQQAEFINPDHDYEYSHTEMVEKLRGAGFDILQSIGLNYAGDSVASGRFSADEVATKRGLFADVERCYLLAYLCRPAGA